MTKRKSKPQRPADWTITEEIRVHGRVVKPGTEVSIKGERGRFRFIEHVLTEAGAEWISVVGGPKGVITQRAFHPDRVKTVHAKRTTITAGEARDLMRVKRKQRQQAAPSRAEGRVAAT